MQILLIPEYDSDNPQPYPGYVEPGRYDTNQLVDMLRRNAHDPDAILFIADMLEE